MEKRVDAKLDILTGKVDELKAENAFLKSTLKEVKGGVKTSARRSKEACILLEGKVSYLFCTPLQYCTFSVFAR